MYIDVLSRYKKKFALHSYLCLQMQTQMDIIFWYFVICVFKMHLYHLLLSQHVSQALLYASSGPLPVIPYELLHS